MSTNKNLKYGVVALVGAAIALLTGVPAYLLLILICPLMMLFMMASMSGGVAHRDADPADANSATTPPTP